MNDNCTWFKDWFGEDYLLTYPHRSLEQATAEVDNLLKVLKLEPSATILDVACGTGRHLSRFQQKQFKAFGIDLSLTLLEKARAHGLSLAQSDMRSLPLKSRTFDAVVSFFTSFGYFESDQENQMAIEEISRVLKPQGQFYLDFAHSAYTAKHIVPASSRTVEGRTIDEHRAFNTTSQRLTKKIKISDAKGQRSYYESVKLYSPDQMRSMLRHCGFEIRQEFGDYEMGSLKETSQRYIVIAQKGGA